MRSRFHLIFWTFLILLGHNVGLAQGLPPKREFRAVWICTLANLDWPSSQTSSSDQQKREFIRILDQLQKAGMNAVIVQVRPAGDALYPSKLVPWSQYLSGKQGVPPSPYYDPLEFMIEECHARNMEFHAWFNPFRAISHSRLSSVSSDNLINRRPEWVFSYGISKYFNPGIPAVRNYLVRVIMEVVKNYDIDGIHLDDYFYPYPIAGETLPDAQAYKQYGAGHGDVKSWRRHNVDAFVEELADSIFLGRPNVKFGISPFGVWRNDDEDLRGSGTVRALSAYDALYADTRKWLKYGWVDYMVPQLYWGINNTRAPFDVLLEWWDKQGTDRHVYIGHAIYLMGEESKPSWAKCSEFVTQAKLCREQDQICGNVWFRCATIMANSGGIANSLQKEIYPYPALVPSMPWIDSIPPNRPTNLQILQQPEGIYLAWDAPEPAEDFGKAEYYVIYRFEGTDSYDLNDPRNIVGITKQQFFQDTHSRFGHTYTYAVTSVDRLHNESRRFVYQTVSFE